MNDNGNEISEQETARAEAIIFATIASFTEDTLKRYVARVLILGRPTIVMQPRPSQHAAILCLHDRWPGAVIVDQDTFAGLEQRHEHHVARVDPSHDRNQVNG